MIKDNLCTQFLDDRIARATLIVSELKFNRVFLIFSLKNTVSVLGIAFEFVLALLESISINYKRCFLKYLV